MNLRQLHRSNPPAVNGICLSAASARDRAPRTWVGDGHDEEQGVVGASKTVLCNSVFFVASMQWFIE